MSPNLMANFSHLGFFKACITLENYNAPTMMIADKFADFLLYES